MITINNIQVEILRKNIKNSHLAVYPPNGIVRLSVPENISDDKARLLIIKKLSWIKKQQQQFQQQNRQSARDHVSGECHFYLGDKYRFKLIETTDKATVKALRSGILQMRAKKYASIATKKNVLTNWYKQQLTTVLTEILAKWQPIIGKQPLQWNIRKMKTKWGSCDFAKQKIVFNLELIKQSYLVIEYIVVHELTHLHERLHSERFYKLLTKFLPQWRSRKELLQMLTLQDLTY